MSKTAKLDVEVLNSLEVLHWMFCILSPEGNICTTADF